MSELEQYLSEFYSPETAKAYSREINRFLQENKKAEKAVYKDLIQYIGTLRNRYSNANTLNRLIASIKVYYEFLSHTGMRKDNPAKSIRLRDKKCRDIQLQDLFSTEELETLFESKERYLTLEYRNKILASLLIYQALHPNELEAITINDVNLEEGLITVKATPKTNKRELALKTNQIMLFHHYISEIRPKLMKEKETNIFLLGLTGNPMQAEDITKHITRHYKPRFEGRKITATTIRQSVICNQLKSGKDLREVQVFAGHKYLSSTEKYKQSDLELLKTEIEKYYPFK